jgi:hypothetical protein
VAGGTAAVRITAQSFRSAAHDSGLAGLARRRASLAQESSRIASRLQKVLEEAKSKLASVASDVWGQSGQATLMALLAGQEDAGPLADLARGWLRTPIPQRQCALAGLTREHHWFLPERLVGQWQFVESETELLDQRLEQMAQAEPALAEAVARWDSVSGVDRMAAGGLQRKQCSYQDLGSDHRDRVNAEGLK